MPRTKKSTVETPKNNSKEKSTKSANKQTKNKSIKVDGLFDPEPIEASVSVDKEVKKEPPEEKSYKMTTECDLCGAKINCDPNYAKLSWITGKAPWHRSCSKDKLALCDNCAMELSSIVDKWVISKNNNMKKPYSV